MLFLKEFLKKIKPTLDFNNHMVNFNKKITLFINRLIIFYNKISKYQKVIDNGRCD